MKINTEFWPVNPMGDRFRFRRPAWMPEYFWRRTVRLRVLNVASLFLLIGVVATVLLLRYPRGWIGPFIYLTMISQLITWGIWPRRLRRRIKRQLEEHDHLLCLTCGYPLDGLPIEHRCPECGTNYHADRVREAWKHWVFHCKLPRRKRPRGSGEVQS